MKKILLAIAITFGFITVANAGDFNKNYFCNEYSNEPFIISFADGGNQLVQRFLKGNLQFRLNVQEHLGGGVNWLYKNGPNWWLVVTFNPNGSLSMVEQVDPIGAPGRAICRRM